VNVELAQEGIQVNLFHRQLTGSNCQWGESCRFPRWDL